MHNPTKFQIRWVSQILGFPPFFFFFFFFFFLSYIMYARQNILIGSKKHAYVSPDSINEVKKAVTITFLFLQLK